MEVHDLGGSGDTVVLVHGWGGSHAAWSDLAPRLAVDRRVLAVDVRDWRSALADLGAALDGRGATIVGHSLGGTLAVLYALEHPETRAVVNVDGYSAGADPTLFRGLEPDLVRERLAEVRRYRVARGVPAEALDAIEAVDTVALMPRLSCPLLVVLATEPEPAPPELPWLGELEEAHFQGILQQLTGAGVRVELLPATHGEMLRHAALPALVRTGIP